jgi:hypothetical protein
MKMLDSRACVGACVAQDRVGQLMTVSQECHPNLIIRCGQRVDIDVTCTHVVLWAGRLGRVQGE